MLINGRKDNWVPSCYGRAGHRVVVLECRSYLSVTLNPGDGGVFVDGSPFCAAGDATRSPAAWAYMMNQLPQTGVGFPTAPTVAIAEFTGPAGKVVPAYNPTSDGYDNPNPAYIAGPGEYHIKFERTDLFKTYPEVKHVNSAATERHMTGFAPEHEATFNNVYRFPVRYGSESAVRGLSLASTSWDMATQALNFDRQSDHVGTFNEFIDSMGVQDWITPLDPSVDTLTLKHIDLAARLPGFHVVNDTGAACTMKLTCRRLIAVCPTPAYASSGLETKLETTTRKSVLATYADAHAAGASVTDVHAARIQTAHSYLQGIDPNLAPVQSHKEIAEPSFWSKMGHYAASSATWLGKHVLQPAWDKVGSKLLDRALVNGETAAVDALPSLFG